MERTQWAVSAAVCWASLFFVVSSIGQVVSEFKNEVDAVSHLHYAGGSEWLVAQADPESHWHRLPDLTDVTLNNFTVSREALRYVLSLKQLKGLELGVGPEGIEIEPEDLELLGAADHLDSLGLCFADMTNDHLRFLPEMDGLESLEISGILSGDSRFTDELAHVLVAVHKLRRIRIRSNNFTDEFVRILSEKRELESLDIGSPHLTDVSLALIGQLPAMRKLRFSSPLVTDEGVRNLRGLAFLEELKIDSPKIGSEALSIVSELGRLTYLDLSLDTVRPEDLASLRKLKSLKILALRKVPLRNEEFSALLGHPSIESLFFEQAQLTEKSLPVIESLKMLKYVAFSTRTEASRHLLEEIAKRGIVDGSFYPKVK